MEVLIMYVIVFFQWLTLNCSTSEHHNNGCAKWKLTTLFVQLTFTIFFPEIKGVIKLYRIQLHPHNKTITSMWSKRMAQTSSRNINTKSGEENNTHLNWWHERSNYTESEASKKQLIDTCGKVDFNPILSVKKFLYCFLFFPYCIFIVVCVFHLTTNLESFCSRHTV